MEEVHKAMYLDMFKICTPGAFRSVNIVSSEIFRRYNVHRPVLEAYVLPFFFFSFFFLRECGSTNLVATY